MKPLRVPGDLHRRVLVHRRLLGAVCAFVAVWYVVQATAAPPAATTPVWTAARDLPSGTVLSRDDLVRTAYRPGSEPAAAVTSPGSLLGRTLATPVGRGEPITPAHLTGAERLAAYPGRSAVALRIPDAAVAALLTPGQRVTLVASDPQGGSETERLVDDAAVLAVPKSDPDVGGAAIPGRLVVFAVPTERADALVAAGATLYLSVVWSR